MRLAVQLALGLAAVVASTGGHCDQGLVPARSIC